MLPQWDLGVLKAEQGRGIPDFTSTKPFQVDKDNVCSSLAFCFWRSLVAFTVDYSFILKLFLNFCSQFSPAVLSGSLVVSSQFLGSSAPMVSHCFPGTLFLASVFLLYTIS